MDLLKNLNLEWKATDPVIFSVILLATCAFIVFWFATHSENILRFLGKNCGEEALSFRHFLLSKFGGFIVLGIIPVCCMLLFFDDWKIADFGVVWNPSTAIQSMEWILILSVLVIPLVSFSARKPKNLRNYPQIRTRKWSRTIFIWNLIGWAFYLVGYELLFRGVLFFPLFKVFGIWPAIAINCALYAATHIPKGLDETIGALVLGFVLCVLTAATGTIWIALVVHIVMAWTNSLTALYYHPEINFEKWKKK